MRKSKLKKKKKAKIYKLASVKVKGDKPSSSEIARNLFSETWRTYLDEVHMVAVGIGKKKKVKRNNSKKAVRLSLLD